MSAHTAASDKTIPPKSSRTMIWLRSRLSNIAPFITLLFLVVFFSIASPSFATLDNVGNILNQVSITAIMAGGLHFVVPVAGNDLGVPSIANANGIVVG